MDDKSRKRINKFFDETLAEIREPHEKIIEMLRFMIGGIPETHLMGLYSVAFHEIMAYCKILCTMEMNLGDLVYCINEINELREYIHGHIRDDDEEMSLVLDKTLEKLKDRV